MKHARSVKNRSSTRAKNVRRKARRAEEARIVALKAEEARKAAEAKPSEAA